MSSLELSECKGSSGILLILLIGGIDFLSSIMRLYGSL